MIITEIVDTFENAIRYTKKTIPELHVMELGNITIKNCLGVQGKLSSKQWFLNNNVASHTSIDVNGRDGALPLDLGTRLPQYDNTADFILDGGTSEHVDNIYEAYKNKHEWCKKGGIMISWGPPTGTAKHHSPWSYNLHFPAMLSIYSGYALLEQDIRVPVKGRNPNPKDNFLIVWICQKLQDTPFLSVKDWNDLQGVTKR